ncbi:hypothetical protein Scep_004192 [Stephania cephalantha]|uniref:Uncharacterized protein n=1 Tax=Stephania cephalantha TaxID=152367 RepID=A0AAP0KRZ3_9MAGN
MSPLFTASPSPSHLAVRRPPLVHRIAAAEFLPRRRQSSRHRSPLRHRCCAAAGQLVRRSASRFCHFAGSPCRFLHRSNRP